ncbi:MAG TPA: response regulator transcription factor [Spirochaetota bacterium]|nr:response regulator transcription factor [Spirochaetota bacterium]HQP47497.1 response regulator transcription factor [Spirochaetota bacterium]
MKKAIIADDHVIIRKGIIHILGGCNELCEIDEADDGQDLLEKTRKKNYDLILLDISMPGRNGIEVLKQLRIEHPKIPVIILSIHSEDQYAIRAIKSGAAGYLTKEILPDKLVHAVETVLSGRKYITSSIAEQLANQFDENMSKAPHERLTDREYEVLCRLASGATITGIAQELYLSAKTISTYRHRILQKMNLKNNAELIKYCFDNKLAD